MGRQQGFTFGVLVAAVVVMTSWSTFAIAQPAPAPPTTSGNYVPRHERIASSIIRRKAASGVDVRSGTLMAAQEASVPTSSEMLPLGEIAPSPPATLGVSNAMTQEFAPTPILDPASAPTMEYEASGVTSSYPGESYPITPDQPYAVEQPGIAYSDPFSTPVQDMAYATGCDAGGGYGCDGSCGGGCGAGGYRCIDSFSLNVGVVGYKNMINRGSSGSFGFQEGFNWGAPWVVLGMNSQIGFRATQSDFNGSDFTTNHRAQYFVTGGLYHRNYHGWQGGFVFDYLHDDWYTTIDLGQLRGELSWAVPNGSSLGVLFATSVASDESTSLINGRAVDESWESHDMMAFFYKVQSNQNRRGQFRVYAGFTGESDGLIGSDFKIPLAGTWSLEPEFTYVVPDEPTGQGGHDQEAWNVAFNLVWYPGRARGNLNYNRLPLIDVAGNGSMISRLK